MGCVVRASSQRVCGWIPRDLGLKVPRQGAGTEVPRANPTRATSVARPSHGAFSPRGARPTEKWRTPAARKCGVVDGTMRYNGALPLPFLSACQGFRRSTPSSRHRLYSLA